jgi:hypothetical protein
MVPNPFLNPFLKSAASYTASVVGVKPLSDVAFAQTGRTIFITLLLKLRQWEWGRSMNTDWTDVHYSPSVSIRLIPFIRVPTRLPFMIPVALIAAARSYGGKS